MTQIHWANPVSGAFSSPSDWTGGVVPGPSDDAILNAAGAAFTVTANTYESVNSIQTAANATLDIGFEFTATAGTGAGVNAGKIVIGDYGVLTVGGMLTNTGAILMASTGPQSLLEISASTTLRGGGAISLTSSPGSLGDEIFSASSGVATLTNVDNTISGTGAIVGDSRGYHLILVNEAKGVIDANGSVAPLYVLPGGYTTVNAGLIEATGAGRLVLGDGTFANTGTIQNAGFGTLVIGGTIDDSRGGTLILGAHANLDRVGVILGGALTLEAGQTLTSYSGYLEAATVTNRGVIAIKNKYGLHLQGAVNNIGTIGLDSTGAYTFLEIGAAGVTLSGGGSVSLGGNGGNQGSHITGYQLGVQTLTNIDNTISGAGTIGPGPDGSEVGLVLVNEARGVIDANGAAALTLSTGVITNSGLIEATSPGGLTIQTNVFQGPVVTVNGSAGGVILAASGSQVALKTATLIGGTLESIGTGEIKIFAGGPDVLDGTTSAIDNKATVVVQNSAALTIQGAIVNADRIALISSGSATTLTVGAAGATLSGGGAVITTNNANNIITGASSAATLINVDNTIDGAGRLGDGSMTMVNEAKGVIVDPFATVLVIDTGANTIVNAGLIVAKGAGGVTIQSAVNNSGRLEAAGGVLTVNGAVSGSGEGVIAGGTLDFASSFTQRVIFAGTTGLLELAQSQSYTGAVFGFSKTGGTSLDLRDIGFVGSAEATFSGTASGGVLTETDGTHTAHITLKGDYRASTFIASSDGHGGVIVVDPAASSAHRLVAAAASLGAGGGGPMNVTHDAWRVHPPMLSRPGIVIA